MEIDSEFMYKGANFIIQCYGEENINDGFIGDGEYVRNDMTNENNNYDYSPNLNGQNLYAY